VELKAIVELEKENQASSQNESDQNVLELGAFHQDETIRNHKSINHENESASTT
jgi:hypothetical protein